MSDSKKVSVICLCYNHADFVYEALESVKNQTHQNVELIIVDDCSKDNSVEVIRNWVKNYDCVFIANQKNLGNTKSFNKAYAKCNGDFIIDLAADDVLNKDFISNHLNTFKNSNYPELGVVYANAEAISANGTHIKFHYEIDDKGKAVKKPPTGDIYRNLLFEYFINSPSMMGSKAVFDYLNGYDEDLAYEDLDFWIRSSRKFQYDFTDAVLVKKRILPNSHGKKFYKNRGKEISNSTFKVLLKALELNRSKIEYKALCNRILYEIKLSIKVRNYYLASKFGLLYGRSYLRSI